MKGLFMYQVPFCRVCGREITAKDFLGTSTICRCGWSDQKAQKKIDQVTQKRTITAFFVTAALLMLGFHHAYTWGRHATEVPLLKLAKMTGTISDQGLEKLFEACRNQGQWSCVDETAQSLYLKTKDSKYLARLASIQSRRGLLNEAARTYDAYVAAGGREYEALIRFAQLLELQKSTINRSLEILTLAVENPGDRLPVRAMSILLKILMSEGRHQEALERLTRFHEQSTQAKDYFAQELKTLNEIIKRSKKVAAR